MYLFINSDRKQTITHYGTWYAGSKVKKWGIWEKIVHRGKW